MQLSPVMEKYILHWGEMGNRWGVNRSVAQIHALLFLAENPLTAEEIADTLGIARSNVSTSLKELQGWNLAEVTHVLGDRRDHFETKTDAWDMFMTIVEERKRREIDPTLRMLAECVEEAKTDSGTPEDVKTKLENMQSFLETLSGWYGQIKLLPRGTLVKLMSMGASVARAVTR